MAQVHRVPTPPSPRLRRAVVLAAAVCGCGGEAPPHLGVGIARVAPHQDEWWPHFGRLGDSGSEIAGPTDANDAFDRAAALWLMDRPQEALEAAGPGPDLASMALRGAAHRRLGDTSAAEDEYLAEGARFLDPAAGAFTNNYGWFLYRRWLDEVRGSTGAGVAHDLDMARAMFQLARSLGEPLGLLNLAAVDLATGEIHAGAAKLAGFDGEFGDTADAAALGLKHALLAEVAQWGADWRSAETNLGRALSYASDADGGRSEEVSVADAHLLMLAGIAASERGAHERATSRLGRALGALRLAASEASEPERATLLAETAQQCARDLALAQIRGGRGEGLDVDGVLEGLAAQSDDGTWQGLLSLLLSGERSVEGVLASIPDVGSVREAELAAEARLTAAQHLVLEGEDEDALALLESLERPGPGGRPLAWARCLSLKKRLAKGELVP